VELTVTQDQLVLIYVCSGLTSVDGELISNRASDAALTGNIRVEANLIRRAAVVDPRRLDQDLDVDFAHVLRHCLRSAPTRTILSRHIPHTTKETSSKILRRLHHAILTLRAEHRQLT
jgi:serine/threonine protein kinase HipA of HipAB toxin-antitoxin module